MKNTLSAIKKPYQKAYPSVEATKCLENYLPGQSRCFSPDRTVRIYVSSGQVSTRFRGKAIRILPEIGVEGDVQFVDIPLQAGTHYVSLTTSERENHIYYWKSVKKIFRELWGELQPTQKIARIYLAISHGAVELERVGIPYPEKKSLIEKAISKIRAHIQNTISISKQDIFDLEHELAVAGFKTLETNDDLIDVNAHYGFVDEIKENGIAKVFLKIGSEEVTLDFPLETLPLYLRYEGAGVCWIERIYSSDLKLARFEPGGALSENI